MDLIGLLEAAAKLVRNFLPRGIAYIPFEKYGALKRRELIDAAFHFITLCQQLPFPAFYLAETSPLRRLMGEYLLDVIDLQFPYTILRQSTLGCFESITHGFPSVCLSAYIKNEILDL